MRRHDFVNYKQDNKHRDHDVSRYGFCTVVFDELGLMVGRRYMIQKPEDYVCFDGIEDLAVLLHLDHY